MGNNGGFYRENPKNFENSGKTKWAMRAQAGVGVAGKNNTFRSGLPWRLFEIKCQYLIDCVWKKAMALSRTPKNTGKG